MNISLPLIKKNLLQSPSLFLQEILKYCSKSLSFVIVSDENVGNLYSKNIQKTFLENDMVCHLILFPPGEKNKTRKTKELIEDQMLALNLGCDTVMIAIGGGITTDLAGFIASTYCRGIPLISVPTTLLGMIDASIGGKNGVNTDHGKNMIGTIYEPLLTIIDPLSIRSLDLKNVKEGLVEAFKHAIIYDHSLFSFYEDHQNEILSLNESVIEELIERNCQIKLSIVLKNSKTFPIRHLLNFGHTIGHAIEKASSYKVSHGQAVAVGILIESLISSKLNLLPLSDYFRIKKLFDSYEIETTLSEEIYISDLLEAMKLDKKSKNQSPRFVILDKIGLSSDCKLNFLREVELSILNEAISTILARK